MTRPAIVMALAALSFSITACGRGSKTDATAASAAKQLDFGAHHLQVVVPAGWEALDQGKQKRFRKGEWQIVLQNLGSPAQPARDFDELVKWGLESVGYNERNEIKTRNVTTIDGREAVDIETWSRLSHSNPTKITFVKDGDELFALTTEGMALEDSLAAFDTIRSSLHFASARQ